MNVPHRLQLAGNAPVPSRNQIPYRVQLAGNAPFTSQKLIPHPVQLAGNAPCIEETEKRRKDGSSAA